MLKAADKISPSVFGGIPPCGPPIMRGGGGGGGGGVGPPWTSFIRCSLRWRGRKPSPCEVGLSLDPRSDLVPARREVRHGPRRVRSPVFPRLVERWQAEEHVLDRALTPIAEPCGVDLGEQAERDALD